MAVIEAYSSCTRARLSRIVGDVIRKGGLVGVPTETYYGLAANPLDSGAVARLISVKGRGDGKPILTLIGNRAQLSMLVLCVSPTAEVLMDAFWPGPLTLLFTAHPSLPPSLTANSGTVGVRLSSCAPLVELLDIVGPVTGTSANRTGCPPACTAAEVEGSLGEHVELIVDAGKTPGGLPSTVIDARDAVRMVRDGAISRQMVQNVLQTRGIALL